MTGKALRCDHDGCDAMFPTTPVRGWHWPIRAEAEKVGWVSSRTGLYDAGGPDVKDYCPEHASDLDVDRERLIAQVYDGIDSVAESLWKSTVSDEPPVLTLEMLQAAIDDIKAAPRVPIVERRGTTIYVDGVPTFELVEPILTRPMDWVPAAREILFGMNVVPEPPGFRVAVDEHVRRQLAERHSRITDLGSA